MSFDLTGKVAIITGASSGIGLKSAQALLAANCSVLGIDISPRPAALSADNPHFRFHQCNLADAVAPAEVVKTCHAAFGDRIDILHNVAGIMDGCQSVDTVTDEVWDRLMAVNLTAPVKLMREVVPVMKRQGGGSIVNISSLAGISGNFAGVAYTASKHGLIGATKNVAFRFRLDKIRCNAVLPGAVATNIHTSYDPSKTDMEALDTLMPVYKLRGEGNGIEPDDVADLLLFLSTDASKTITGTCIPVGSVLT